MQGKREMGRGGDDKRGACKKINFDKSAAIFFFCCNLGKVEGPFLSAPLHPVASPHTIARSAFHKTDICVWWEGVLGGQDMVSASHGPSALLPSMSGREWCEWAGVSPCDYWQGRALW